MRARTSVGDHYQQDGAVDGLACVRVPPTAGGRRAPPGCGRRSGPPAGIGVPQAQAYRLLQRRRTGIARPCIQAFPRTTGLTSTVAARSVTIRTYPSPPAPRVREGSRPAARAAEQQHAHRSSPRWGLQRRTGRRRVTCEVGHAFAVPASLCGVVGRSARCSPEGHRCERMPVLRRPSRALTACVNKRALSSNRHAHSRLGGGWAATSAGSPDGEWPWTTPS